MKASYPLSISIPVPWGELIDKITILEIKLSELSDVAALVNVKKEHLALCLIRDDAASLPEELSDLADQMLGVNKALWKIEDDIRDCERSGDFGPKFVELARSVYVTNDKRAALKRDVNKLMNSDLYEEKSYAQY